MSREACIEDRAKSCWVSAPRPSPAILNLSRSPCSYTSVETLLSPSVETDPKTTLDTSLEISMQLPARSSTPVLAVQSLCPQIRPDHYPGGLNTVISLRISVVGALTRIARVFPLPVGLKKLMPSKLRSETYSVVPPVRFAPANTGLRSRSFFNVTNCVR